MYFQTQKEKESKNRNGHTIKYNKILLLFLAKFFVPSYNREKQLGGKMMTPQEIFAKSLVTYDKSYRSNDSFYYHLPYHKDYDLCNWNPMRMYSGNVIKYYQYHLSKPVILFTDTDE